MRGTDTDNFDGAVAAGRFQTLHDLWDVRFNIVGAQVGADGRNYSPIQIVNAERAGLRVPLCYDFLFYAGESGAEGLERMRHATQFGKPVAPDIEGAAHPGGVNQMIDLMAQARDILRQAGLFWGWYSSPPEWQRITGGTLAFAGDRGWTAAYPFSTATEAILPPVRYMPPFDRFPGFGGTLPVAWQYANIAYGEPTFDMNAWNPKYGEDTMERLNAVSPWYEDAAHQRFTGTRGINATKDFGVSADVVAVQLEVYTVPGSGVIQARDGDEKAEAPSAFNVEPPALYMAGRVELERIAGDGWCHLSAVDEALLRRVAIVGTYLA